jgi:hypothetical protein
MAMNMKKWSLDNGMQRLCSRFGLRESIAWYPLKIYGHKLRLLDKILPLIPSDTQTVIDLFAGSGIVAWAAKQQGMQVISNDIRRYSFLAQRTIVANNRHYLKKKDLRCLLQLTRNCKNYAEQYYLKVFGQTNCHFLDNWAANVEHLDCSIKKDIAVFIPIACVNSHLNYAAINWSPVGTLTGYQNFYGVTEHHRLYPAPLLHLASNHGRRESVDDCEMGRASVDADDRAGLWASVAGIQDEADVQNPLRFLSEESGLRLFPSPPMPSKCPGAATILTSRCHVWATEQVKRKNAKILVVAKT